MNKDLKLGDVVVLKSGGTNMTVTQIRLGSNPGEVVVECTWFEGPFGDQKEKLSSYPIEALKKVSQQAKKVTTSPEIKEGLRNIKSSLPSRRQSGLDELIRLNATDKLMDLLGNKDPEIRELAAFGLAKLQHFPALPDLIDVLNVIEGKNPKDLIPNVENLLVSFGESAIEEILKKVPEKGISRDRKNRWVTAISNVIIDDSKASQLLAYALRNFKSMVERRFKKDIPSYLYRYSSWQSRDPVSTPLEIILEAVIVSEKSLEPKLLNDAATAYVAYNHHKIKRRVDVLKWLAKNRQKKAAEVIQMIAEWARTAIQIYENEVREFGDSEDTGYDVVAVLENAFKLEVVSSEEVVALVANATIPELVAKLKEMVGRISDA